MRLPILVCLLFLVLSADLVAQGPITIEKRILAARLDSTYILIGKVDTSTIRVLRADSAITSRRWRFDPSTSGWSIIDSTLAGQDLTVRYSTQPWISPGLLDITYYRQAPTDSTGTPATPGTQRLSYTRGDIFGSSTIQRSGSLTRGITFGSNRDASLESGLRLDLAGNITDDVEILATLTDQSTPIQPDGSTQTLREFDQVFIRLRSPLGQLQLGDVDVVFDRSRFARVNRRLQGADVLARTGIGDQRATASVARGVFRSQTLAGIDGVQGPYRLAGASGETFIIVLAGTENVFLDGRPLSRGEENDYVIDYGLGEITFTNRHFINSKSRITVDFQYISQQYTRSFVAAESQASDLLGGRLDIRATVIREADGNNPNAQLLLSPSEIDVLRRAGGDLSNAVVSGVEPYNVSDGEQRVRYVRRDTTVNGSPVTFYKADASSPESAYSIRFSRADAGKGAYVRSGSSLNGFIFQWVGQGRGDYDTLRTLVAPIDKMVASLDLNMQVAESHKLYGEVAGSRNDLNRFSSLAGTTEEGLAWTVGMKGGSIDNGETGLWYDAQHTSYSRDFVFFDRPRDVEFDRLWNIGDGGQTKERQSIVRGGWNGSPYSSLSATGGLLRRDRVQSERLQAIMRSEEPGWISVSYDGSVTQSSDSLLGLKGSWQRHLGELGRAVQVGGFVMHPSVRLEHENRVQRDISSDSLAVQSLQFTDLNPSVTFRDASQRWSMRLSGSFRTDQLPLSGIMERESNSITRSVGWSYDAGRRFSTEQEIGWRDVTYTDGFKLAQGRDDNTSLQVRSVVRYSIGGRFLEGQWNYDLRSERRSKLQERYFEVGPELGSFIWEDLNGDGIQDIDEFFPERIPGEGTFLLQFVPGDDFIPVTSLDTGLRHTIRFGEIKGTSPNGILKQLELTSRLSVRESSSDMLRNLYFVRLSTFQGAETQQGRIFSTHELRLAQASNRVGFRAIHDYSTSANRLVQGLDTQFRTALRGIVQYRIDDMWSAEGQMVSSITRNESELLASRGYDIRSGELRPVLFANFSRKFIGSISGAYIRRTDRMPSDPVELTAWSADVDGTLFHGRGGRTRVSLSRRLNSISGFTTSYGLYELTDGGTAGVVWSGSLQSDYRISDFIRASVNYDMRKFPARPFIQTFRVVVSAVL